MDIPVMEPSVVSDLSALVIMSARASAVNGFSINYKMSDCRFSIIAGVPWADITMHGMFG